MGVRYRLRESSPHLEMDQAIQRTSRPRRLHAAVRIQLVDTSLCWTAESKPLDSNSWQGTWRNRVESQITPWRAKPVPHCRFEIRAGRNHRRSMAVPASTNIGGATTHVVKVVWVCSYPENSVDPVFAKMG